MDPQNSNLLQPPQNQLQQQQNQIDEEEQIRSNANQNSTTRLQKMLPKQFHKAKRTATRLVNQYFANLKQEMINCEGNGKFIYARQHIQTLESALSKIATIRYTDLNTLVPKKSQLVDDFLLSYIGQSKKIIKYNLNIHNNNNQKPKQIQLYSQENFQLPDSATPAAFGGNAYFFDGSKFDLQRFVYIPVLANYKINLLTGQVSIIQKRPELYRIKCCILKVKKGFFIIGGYAGLDKILTKQCSFFSIQTNQFTQIQSLNNLHNCPSGCIHNDKIYIFSNSGIQFYQESKNMWVAIQMPKRLRCLSFQYCLSVSSSQIMIIGGKICNQNSTDIKIYNTQFQRVDQYNDVLTVGVCSQRSWGPMIVNNYITIMSNIQASVIPQVTIKKDAIQLVFIGFGGCFVNTLLAS